MESQICKTCKTNPVWTTNDPSGQLYIDAECLECLKISDKEEQDWIEQEQCDLEAQHTNDDGSLSCW